MTRWLCLWILSASVAVAAEHPILCTYPESYTQILNGTLRTACAAPQMCLVDDAQPSHVWSSDDLICNVQTCGFLPPYTHCLLQFRDLASQQWVAVPWTYCEVQTDDGAWSRQPPDSLRPPDQAGYLDVTGWHPTIPINQHVSSCNPPWDKHVRPVLYAGGHAYCSERD